MIDAVTDRTHAALDALRTRLPALREVLVPGTRLRWQQRDSTPAQRARMDAVARDDRHAKEINLTRGIKAIGASAAPLRIDVLDTIDSVDSGVIEIEATICEWFGLTPLDYSTTSARITRVIGLLGRVSEHKELADFIDLQARVLNRLAGHAIGDEEPVYRLDARCPHCNARALRALPDRESIVCVNGSCRCDDAGCRCHELHPKKHVWLYTEWEHLATIIPSDVRTAA